MKSLDLFRRRQKTFLALLFVGLCIATVRLYQLQVTPNSLTLGRAKRQYTKSVPIQPQRGTILDQRGRTLALSVLADSFFVRPAALARPPVAARLLSKALSLPEQEIQRKMASKQPFVWLKRQTTLQEGKRVVKMKLKGVGALPEGKRYYPKGQLGGHFLGFVGFDNKGLEGLEYAYDPYLRGVPGSIQVSRDGRGRSLYPLEMIQKPPRRGLDLILTIDEAIQYFAESALNRATQKAKAKSGIAIVLEPDTGRILALAASPGFNPNQFRNTPGQGSGIPGITTAFEPGSTFKLITMAAYLEQNGTSLRDWFDCKKGRYRIAGRTIHDVHPHSKLTVKQAFQFSSNICTIRIAETIGPINLYSTIRRFGFGVPTRSGLPSESPGLVRKTRDWTRGSIAAVPIGQEVSVNALQVTVAYAAVANGGYLMRPRIVRGIQDRGQTVRIFAPKIVRRALSAQTAQKLKRMLAGVVEHGTGKAARLRGYSSAGKTGTAQQIDPVTRTYSKERFVASFVGFVPVEHPRIVIFVSIDHPKTNTYGGVVAAPVFREIAERTLRYLRIPPSGEPQIQASGSKFQGYTFRNSLRKTT